MKYLMISLLLVTLFVSPLVARDLRQAAQETKTSLDNARKTAGAVEKTIGRERTQVKEQLVQMNRKLDELEKEIKENRAQIEHFSTENAALEKRAAQDQTQLNEISGAVRVAAGNLKATLTASMYTAADPGRLESLSPMLDTSRFPGIDDMQAIADLFLEEMKLTGGIDLSVMPFVSDTGETTRGKVLTLGGFTSAYSLNGKVGFLEYSPHSQKLYALAADPPRGVKKNLARYMAGQTDQVYIDISRGAALKQITHQQSLRDQIEKGGLLVWPILALGVLAVLIGIERMVFLGRVHSNTDKVMGTVNDLAARGAWGDCHNMVGKKKIPVHNVLRAGLNAREQNRETLESILQEAILKEMPKLERYLPMLNIMGAVAPLLGLLGTVTGMISTFHVITLYGTGDPRMMSGGISTALVTTMLGLGVAIPIMLLYTFLCRRVEHVIGDMEEKAVALTNIIFREAGA